MPLTPSVARVAAAAFVALAAALGLAACGRGSTSPAPSNAAATSAAPSVSASAATGSGDTGSPATDCAYISAAQISQIEGATYAAPTVFHGICNWIGSDGNAISITLTRNATEAAWQDVLATVLRDQSTDAPTPIASLGDRAAGAGQEIAVQHGATIIDIRGGDTPGYGKWPKSTAIANAIIAGLH